MHGLSTVGWDDEGVAGQQWDIVKDGVLVGYQVDRNMARLRGLPRSNGCAFADSPGHVPVQRMANVSLQPAPGGPSTEEIIAGVERGIYVVGDKSWSIDMQRYNFQFTGQRFYRIEGGRLAGQLRDVAYQATTTDFWGSMSVVGGPQTYVLGGAFNCGKAQPGQVAPVSHGCPTRPVREREHPQHRAGGRPMSQLPQQQIVEQALAASTADGQVTFVVESSEANLRWAGNSLTTNGAMRSRQVVVVSFVDGGAGMAAGTVARTGTPDIAELVAASEQAARDAGPAEDAVPLVSEAPGGTGDWDAEPAETSIERLRASSRRRSGEAFGEARDRGRAAVRLRRARHDDDVPRQLDRPAAARTTSPPAGSSSTARAPTSAARSGPARAPATSRDVSVADLAAEVAAEAGAGRSGGSTCRPGATRRCCRRRPSAT